MKRTLSEYFALIIIAGFSVLSGQTCLDVTSLSGPGTNRSYHHTVSPNGVTYFDYKYKDDEPVSFQGQSFAATSHSFIMKLDKNNNFQWIQRIGENSSRYLNIYSIVSDEEDNCFIHAKIHGITEFAGYTFSAESPEWDYLHEVVIKLNSAGELEWATHFSEAYDMIDDGHGSLLLHTTVNSLHDYIYKENNSDTTHVAKRDGAQNAFFSLSKSNGRVETFRQLRYFIGTINNDLNQTASCSFYLLNDKVYLSAYYTEGTSKKNKIFTCNAGGEIWSQKTLDGQVYALFDSPVDSSYLYCHILLEDGTYNTRKYTTDFSIVLAQSENTNSPIFSLYYDNSPNYFVDRYGDITAIVNASTPNYFTYNDENVYENNTRRYAFMQFSPNLELLNFKPVIPGWSYEVYSCLYYLPNSNMFKLIGYGSITNQIDDVSYESEGYQSDVFIFDFLNDANITHPDIILADSVLSINVNETYQMSYTIQESTGNETVEWTSLDSLTASVDSLGMLTGVSAGETTIIATIKASGIADSCSVTVTKPYAPRIVISDAAIDLEVETTYQLSYAIEDGNGTETASWFSLEPARASVSNTGLVTGISVGEAHIIAKINSSSIADTCLLTVSPRTGIKKVLKSDIKIFPNPINDYVSFEANSLINKIEVYDLAGKKVAEAHTAERINLSHLYHGIYFFNVYTEGQKFSYRMIKK